MQVNFCEVNGGRLRTSVQGEGECVLLVHGGYSNMSVWDEHAGVLSEIYKVIRYDHRGYGQSSGPTGPFSYYEDMKSVLDYYGVEKTHIVASSFGGSAAIDFTLQYPEYVDKLILVGPSVHGIGYPFRMKWEGILDYMRVKRVGIERAADRILRKSFWSYMVPQDEERKLLFRKLYVSNSAFYDSKPTWQQPLLPHAIHRLGDIQQQTLIIEPENDHSFNKKVCDILHGKVKGAVKTVMNDSGHYPHLEHPAAFTSMVLDYLKTR